MTRKGDFVLRRLADEYVLIPYGATTEKMNQVLTLSETAAFIYEQTGDAASAEEIAERLGKPTMCRRRKCRRMSARC